AAHAPQKAPKTPKAACVRAALRRIVHDVPALRQLRRRPRGIGSPAFPARRPRRVCEHLCGCRAHLGRVEVAGTSRGLELVFVLPADGAVRRHDEIELLVDEVDADRRAPLVALEVDVPVRELALAPFVPERPARPEPYEAEAVAGAQFPPQLPFLVPRNAKSAPRSVDRDLGGR